jgi:hypothetical protein
MKSEKYGNTEIEDVLFGDFIFPYLRNSESYSEIHNKLWLGLISNIEGQSQNSTEDLSRLLQERSMLISSLKLIEQKYPQFL